MLVLRCFLFLLSYSLRIRNHKSYKIFSEMPLAKISLLTYFQIIHFQTTVRLLSYMVAYYIE